MVIAIYDYRLMDGSMEEIPQIIFTAFCLPIHSSHNHHFIMYNGHMRIRVTPSRKPWESSIIHIRDRIINQYFLQSSR